MIGLQASERDTMFHTIIAGHDLKDGGEDALSLGRMLADSSEADLVVAGVLPLGQLPYDIGPALGEEAHRLGEGIRARAHDIGVEPQVLRSRSTARGLHELAEEMHADLIIVGSSRRGRVGDILAGNVGLQLLHGAPCAVAVAPVGYSEEEPDLKNIVVGVDGSKEAEAAAVMAAELALATDASIELVAVAEPPPLVYGKGGGATNGYGEFQAAVREVVQTDLDEVVAKMPAKASVFGRMVDGDASDMLAEAASDASLLVIGSRGYGPIGRVLLGSTDAALMRNAPCPVVVLPRQKGRGAVETALGGREALI